MRPIAILTLTLALAAGCSGAHVIEPGDAGPIVTDAGPVTRACHLASPAPLPAFAGEPCYCDGPFVARGHVVYRQSYDLEVIDVSVPGAPRLVTSLRSEAVFANDIDVLGDVLFSAGGALQAYDLRDPLAPVSLGRVEVGGHVEAMAVGPGRVVVAITREDQSHALVPIEASDPRALHVGAPLELANFGVGSMVLRGTTVFGIAMDVTVVSGNARVLAVDVSDPSAPRMVGSLASSAGYLASLGLHDDRLFVSGIESGVSAVDVRDPSAMRDLGVVLPSVPGAQAVAVTNDVLVVGGSGLSLYDLTTPALTLLGRTDPTSDTPHASITGDQLLGSGGNALFSIPLTCD